MTPCPACGLDLADSQYISAAGAGVFALKSCPSCSQRAGRHVFHEESRFGYRQIGTANFVQSWCEDCRNGRPAQQPKRTC
jgi:hypothetical protein